MKANIDQLKKLAVELEHAPEVATDDVRKIVAKGSLNIKNDWKRRWSGMKHLPSLPSSITYDIRAAGTRVVGEIGPEHGRRQATLAHFLENEYGSVRNAPRPGGAPALQAERPRFERALEDAAAKATGL